MAKKNKKKPVAKKAKGKAKAKPVKKKSGKKNKKTTPKKKVAAKKKVTAKKGKTVSRKKVVKKAVKKKIAPKKAAPKKTAKPAKKKNTSPKPKASKKVHVESVKINAHPVGSNHVKASTTTAAETTPFHQHVTSLHEGSTAPYFEGVDQNGNMVRSSDFLGKTLVLYFYPKDFTDGCTAEACSLRDEYQYLRNSNYAVVGVSADDMDSHKRFSDEHHLPFPIIADTDMNIIHSYDVWGQKQLAGHIYDGIVRTTFIIDPDGVIKNIITKVDSANHAQQILAV
jgi:peroxiredoxin Q/BCP